MKNYRREHFKNTKRGFKIAILALGVLPLAILGILFGNNENFKKTITNKVKKLTLAVKNLTA